MIYHCSLPLTTKILMIESALQYKQLLEMVNYDELIKIHQIHQYFPHQNFTLHDIKYTLTKQLRTYVYK